MLYTLILTTYLVGNFDQIPAAVMQTSTLGFTTEQACNNAGKVAVNGAPPGFKTAVGTAFEQGVYGVFRLSDFSVDQWVEEAKERINK